MHIYNIEGETEGSESKSLLIIIQLEGKRVWPYIEELHVKFDFTCLSCLGSSVGKSIAWKADDHGFESHLRQLIFL